MMFAVILRLTVSDCSLFCWNFKGCARAVSVIVCSLLVDLTVIFS